MVFTSRGGVGCCWVKPLIKTDELFFFPLGALSVPKVQSRSDQPGPHYMHQIA